MKTHPEATINPQIVEERASEYSEWANKQIKLINSFYGKLKIQ